MYCVVEMYGKDEPWWFFDGWEANIVSIQHFDNYYTALKYYKHQWLKLAAAFPFYKSRSDSIQQYHSLALLENDDVIPKEKVRPGYNKQNHVGAPCTCPITFK